MEVMKFFLFLLGALLLAPLCLGALNPSFIPQVLSSDDRLLFTCQVEQPGWGQFEALLSADLQKLNGKDNAAIDVLTHFPEQARYYSDTQELEILNSFGLFRAKADEGFKFRRLAAYPSFKQGNSIPKGQFLPALGSPDGRWILIQEATGPVYGKLYLYDNQNGEKTLISSKHILIFQPDFALWSEDSQYVVYSRNSRLYYMAVQFIENARIPDESYREFGKGSLSSVQWAGADTLYYVSDSLVNLIHPSELSSRSFYTNPLSAGSVIGRIPISFDPNLDRFWSSPDGQSLLLLKGGQTLFLIPLEMVERDDKGKSLVLPYLLLPKKMKVLQLWWRSNGDINLLAGGNQRSVPRSLFYQMNTNQKRDAQFELRNLMNIRHFAPSPDGTILGVLENEGVSLRSSDDFKEMKYINHPDPRELIWVDMTRVLIAGGQRTESVLWESGERTLISLSKVDETGFDLAGDIAAVSAGRHYRWKEQSGTWAEVSKNTGKGIQAARLESKSFRVYENVQPLSPYANHIMIRTVDGFGNRTLFNFPDTPRHAFPDFGDDVLHSAFDERVFDHGSRTRGREVALVFNAIDSDEGIGEVLNILADYGIQATFFVGGDFIRRNPDSARALASTDHEIGSLFFTHMDMADYRYRIDQDFVIRGLARNEDEYFRVTKSEISTLWHAPWYVVSPPVLDATQSMNYWYVGRDVDPLDWVTFDAPKETRELYRPSLQLVERILDKVRPGSIVPIRIGKPGKREDYLFNKLELLINGLLRDDYDIVTIGKLREHSL